MLLAFLGLFDKFHCVYVIQMNKSKILILALLSTISSTLLLTGINHDYMFWLKLAINF